MGNWIAIGIGSVIFLIGAAVGIRTYSWVKSAEVTEGTVVELVKKERSRKGKKRSSSYAPKVAYEYLGSSREFISSSGSNPPAFQVGDKVRVVFTQDQRKESIATMGQLYGFSVFGSGIGIAVLVATALMMNGERILKWLHPHLG